jgi:hypothetical protein
MAMEQTTLNLKTPSLTPQAQKLLNRLEEGPITNVYIRDELRLLEYRRRKFEVKKHIEPERTVVKRFLGKGIVEYSIKKLS